MTALAKITAKGQTTIPKEIREAFNWKSGDIIVWEKTSQGVVQVRRMESLDHEYLQAVQNGLGEWSSQADEDAYREL